MRKKHARNLLLMWLALSLFFILPSPVKADGEARPANEAEKKFYQKVMTTLEQSCPAGPLGWEEVERTEIEELEYVGVGSEDYPFSLAYGVEWVDSERSAASEESKVQAGLKTWQENQPDKAEQELMQKLEKIAEATGAAANKGDAAAIQRLTAEAEEIAAKLVEINSARDRKLNQAVEQVELHDIKAEIGIIINTFNESFYSPIIEEDSIQGLRMIRTEGEQSEHYGWREGTTSLFMGDWKKMEEDGSEPFFQAEIRPGIPPTKVQTILIRVQAAPDRAMALIEGLDLDKLKSLLK